MNSNYIQNSQLQTSAQADQSTSHKIDILCLAILVYCISYSLSVFSAASYVLIITSLLFSFVILYGNNAKIVSP